jgi:integrase
MREAQALLADGEAVRAGWLASSAIAVQLLLVMPMRSKNLVELRLDTELLRYDARSPRITHVCVPSDQVKNDVRLEFAVHKDVAAMIETYIRSFRAHLPHANSVWLFPARDAADRPRSQGGLAKAVTAAIKRYVGIDMNVHLFRGYAGKVLLDDDPNAIDELRQLLGHKELETTLMYYTHFKAKKVGQAHIDKMNAKQAVASRSARLPSRFNKPKPRVGKAA